ncbi:MAG: peptidase, partial [Flavobacterium sp.]|nr:peptidase [Flavobacterium sp.]
MKKKIAVTLFLGFLIGTTYAQKMNVAKLDSLFQILEAKDKFMGSIAVSQNGMLVYSKSLGMDDIESNKKASN